MTNTSQDESESEAPQLSEIPVEKQRCLNCDKKLSRKAIFCPNCGQRNNQGKVKLSELLQRFWNNFSHLDAKFVKMCWQLFIPGKVTLEYFRGRQKRYPHPVQFFFVAMFFFLLVTNSLLRDNEDQMSIRDPLDLKTTRGKIELSESYSSKLDSLKQSILRSVNDTLQLDSLFNHFAVKAEFPIKKDSFSFSTYPGGPSFNVLTRDWYMLSADSIAQKYHYNTWFENRALHQAHKMLTFKTGMVKFYLSTLAFSILVLVALYAGILYFFYRKQGRYYVEHFVFLLHLVTAIMLFLATWSAFVNYVWGPYPIFNLAVATLWLILFSFFAQRNYYKEQLRPTFYKWLAGNSIAIFLFIGVFMGGMTLSFMLF